MNAKRIVKRTRTSRRRVKTDWRRVDRMTDAQIEKAIAADHDAAPVLDERWFRTARLVMPERKVPVSMRIDREVLEWFKSRGPRYQSRINAVLKAYMKAYEEREVG